MTVTITRKTAAIIAAHRQCLACAGTATAKSLITGAKIVERHGLEPRPRERRRQGDRHPEGDARQGALQGRPAPRRPAGCARAAGRAGSPGPAGSSGRPGPRGARDRHLRRPSRSTSDTKFLVLACPAGKVALGGGGQILYPAGNWVGSQVAAVVQPSERHGLDRSGRSRPGPVAGPGTWQLEGHVVCAAVAA